MQKRLLFILLCAVWIITACDMLPALQVADPNYTTRLILSPITDVERDEEQRLITVIHTRMDLQGFPQRDVRFENDEILIDLPPTDDDLNALIDLLTTPALLELVDMAGLQNQIDGIMQQSVLTTAQVAYAEAVEIEPSGILNPITNEAFVTVLTSDAFSAAAAIADAYNSDRWFVSFEIASDYQDDFYDYTSNNINEHLAIVLDGSVLFAPVIQAPLSEGGWITSNFTQEEAQQLAAQIVSGVLPYPLAFERIETIGE